MPKINEINDLQILDQDIDIIKKEIKKISSLIEENREIRKIKVIPFYSEKINQMNETQRNNSSYALRFEKIINNYTGSKRLKLKIIALIYF